MHKVHDGRRVYTFDGVLLAKSSSRRPRIPRWVEFELYKTDGGSYILSRIGRSLVYHGPVCETLDRSDGLQPGAISREAVPCEVCQPHLAHEPQPFLPEQNREWAGVMDAPEAVLETLYRYDEAGARFLTRVARELIEKAAEKDEAISDRYFTEHIR